MGTSPIKPPALKGQRAGSRGQQPLPLRKRASSAASPVGTSMLQRLERMEDELTASPTYTGHTRWMIPYADILTLLIGLFILLYAISQDEKKVLTATHQADVQAKQEEIVALKGALKHLTRKAGTSPTAIQTLTEEEPTASNLQAAINEKLKSLQGHSLDADLVEVRQQDRGVVIRLKERLLFEPGKAEISNQAKGALDTLALLLKDLPNPMRIEGHTDNTPISTSVFPSNWELSTSRATNIVKYLVQKHKMAPSQLSAVGYGEYRPIVENSSGEGKQKNRRVDIVIMNGAAAQYEPLGTLQEAASAMGTQTGSPSKKTAALSIPPSSHSIVASPSPSSNGASGI